MKVFVCRHKASPKRAPSEAILCAYTCATHNLLERRHPRGTEMAVLEHDPRALDLSLLDHALGHGALTLAQRNVGHLPFSEAPPAPWVLATVGCRGEIVARTWAPYSRPKRTVPCR